MVELSELKPHDAIRVEGDDFIGEVSMVNFVSKIITFTDGRRVPMIGNKFFYAFHVLE